MERIYDEPVCKPAHDPLALSFTLVLCAGIILSYLPQHYRIFSQRSSAGISPWYLLLGSTSGAAGMLNVVTLQWGVVRCCAKWTAGQCFEGTVGILQVGLAWGMFTLIVVLFLLYYPPSARHHHIRPARAIPSYTDDPSAAAPDLGAEEAEELEELLVATAEWNEAKALSALVLVHLVICTFVTFLLVLLLPPTTPQSPVLQAWAAFLGITASVLACFQYAPQLVRTYKDRLVGALSIPMMCIQSPGAVLFVVSLGIQEGTNWTSWLPYAAAGTMQGGLLIMCLFWKARQARLGIDDFGNPLPPSAAKSTWAGGDVEDAGQEGLGAGELGALVEGQGQGLADGPAPLGLAGDLAGTGTGAGGVDGDAEAGAEGEERADESTPLMVRTTAGTGKVVLPWFSWGKK